MADDLCDTCGGCGDVPGMGHRVSCDDCGGTGKKGGTPDTWVIPRFTPIAPGTKPDFPVPMDEYPRLAVGTVLVSNGMVFKVAAVKEDGGMVSAHFCGMTQSWVKKMRQKYGSQRKRRAEMVARRHKGGKR